ncbi:MAG TPA: hypothetical protein PK715_09745 [Chitinophagales bacterium]|nr:hypothetical protein [Chitinophagales bacterium]
MTFKVKLKNADKYALLDVSVYEHLLNNEYMKGLGFLENLRLHSNGYVFFQKNHPQKDGSYKNETIYLHKYVAERFVQKSDTGDGRKLYVSITNGDKLDCRVANLDWVPRSIAVRNTKRTINKTGYRGVSLERNKYRAVIYQGKQKIDLGFYPTAEAAAEAYNKKSEELFGKTRNLNVIGMPRLLKKKKKGRDQ